MKRMCEHVNLRKILEFFDDIGQPIKYQEFRQTFEDKVKTEVHHENILLNAKQLILNDLNGDTTILKNLYVIHKYCLSAYSLVGGRMSRRDAIIAREVCRTGGTCRRSISSIADIFSIIAVLSIIITIALSA
jgi:hypothetical protein